MEENKITKEEIEKFLKDLTYNPKHNKNNLTIWCWGYEDDKGNFRCGFMEEFDKAMKEYARNMNIDTTKEINYEL